MAMRPFTALEIESAAEELRLAAEKLKSVADDMRAKSFPQLVLQAETAFGLYCAKLMKLAVEAEGELRDQYRASLMGTTPRWKINQKMIEARREAKADRIAKGIEPEQVKTPTTKGPAKRSKRGKTGT